MFYDNRFAAKNIHKKSYSENSKNMQKSLIVFVFVFMLSNAATSQESNGGAKSVYFELLGPSIAGFNYDMRFSKKQDGLGGRVGFGGFKIDGEGAFFIPVGINYLLGKDGKNYLELGTGVTFINSSNRNDFNSNDTEVFNSSFGHLCFGYRYQPTKGGFLFRASISPIFGKNFFFPYYAGISFGYKF
jgi:hypothetical protein